MSIFTDIYVKPPKRSRINLSHDVSLTTDFGKIIPIYLEDVVPGDRFKVATEMAIKLLPTLAPLMSGIEVRVDYFFVPNRLIWNDWEDFITGGTDGTELPVAPYIGRNPSGLIDTFVIGSLPDYFGLPVVIPAGARGNQSTLTPDTSLLSECSILPFRAYNLIWNEYYRDQNLQDEIVISKASGADSTTPLNLLYRGLKKDYFTSALPWAQRGPQVEIPLVGSAPVRSNDGALPSVYTDDNGLYHTLPDVPLASASTQWATWNGIGDEERDLHAPISQSNDTTPMFHQHQVNGSQLMSELDNSMHADLSNASAVTINEFRRLNAVQRWLEKNARAGSRYVEQILAHFGVRTPDFRLDRPEFLGGNKSLIGMTEVLQTSESGDSPQGNRAGVGFGASLNKSKTYHVDEHGWIIGLMSIIPQRNTYCDGVERRWLRTDKFDYYFPSFQFLGEQAIKNKEIYAYGDSEYSEGDFGYTPRYAEYRYHPSGIRGEMRTSMSYWHLGRIFNSAPNLNAQFINSYNALGQYDRIFPTDEQLGDRFIVQLRNHVYAKRPMVKNPNPSL